jgi:hypothetical protein
MRDQVPMRVRKMGRRPEPIIPKARPPISKARLPASKFLPLVNKQVFAWLSERGKSVDRPDPHQDLNDHDDRLVDLVVHLNSRFEVPGMKCR